MQSAQALWLHTSMLEEFWQFTHMLACIIEPGSLETLLLLSAWYSSLLATHDLD